MREGGDGEEETNLYESSVIGCISFAFAEARKSSSQFENYRRLQAM